MSRHIAVVEPQMEGIFHAPFNAALLHSIALAYPEATLSFRAFPSHLQVVQSILQQHAPGLLDRIQWRPSEPPATTSLLARWRHGSRAMREILAPREPIVFCSISRMQLLQLKRAMRPGDVVRAVLHGDLEAIEQPPADRFPLSLFSLPRVLLQRQPVGLRYIILSRSIWENVPPRFQQAMGSVGIIDHPYHFPPIEPTPVNSLIFATFGNTGSGQDLETIASSVKEVNPQIRFRLIGFLVDQASVDRLSPYVEDAGCIPIARDVFLEHARSVTHTLWLCPPGHFRLRASGTFFDALAHGKPLVYTANPYIDSYYAEEPGIGVRCATAADAPQAILSLAAHHTAEGYAAAQAAIERLRKRFTPEEQAKILPDALRLE